VNALTRPGEIALFIKIAVKTRQSSWTAIFMRKIQYCNYEHSDRDYKMKHGAQYKQKNAARHKAWTALFVYIRYYFWKDSSRSPVLTRSPAAT